MATTPILALTEIASNQSNQYLVVNQAIRNIEASINAVMLVDMAGGGVSITNAAPDYDMLRHGVFQISGQSQIETLTFSAHQRTFIVDNQGGYTINVTIGSTVVALSAGDTGRFYGDGTANGLWRVSAV